jgi:hypothetical protein
MAIEDMIKAGAIQAEREPAAGEPAFESLTFESVTEAVQWVTAR